MHQCVNLNLNVISKLVIGIFIVFASFEDIYPTLNPVSDYNLQTSRRKHDKLNF